MDLLGTNWGIYRDETAGCMFFYPVLYNIKVDKHIVGISKADIDNLNSGPWDCYSILQVVSGLYITYNIFSDNNIWRKKYDR